MERDKRVRRGGKVVRWRRRGVKARGDCEVEWGWKVTGGVVGNPLKFVFNLAEATQSLASTNFDGLVEFRANTHDTAPTDRRLAGY